MDSQREEEFYLLLKRMLFLKKHLIYSYLLSYLLIYLLLKSIPSIVNYQIISTRIDFKYLNLYLLGTGFK